MKKKNTMNYQKINNECWKELKENILTYSQYEKIMYQIIMNWCEELYYTYAVEEINKKYLD